MKTPRNTIKRIKLETTDESSDSDETFEECNNEDSSSVDETREDSEDDIEEEDQQEISEESEEYDEDTSRRGEIRMMEENLVDIYENDDDDSKFQDETEILDYRLEAYVNFVIQEKISNNCLDRLDKMMTVLYGTTPLYTKDEVLRVMKKFERTVISGTLYYCNRCGREKRGKYGKCQHCVTSQKNILETSTFITCNLQWQLEKLLRHHASEILYSHSKIHRREEHLFLPHDVRRFEGYRRMVESVENFERGNIQVICSYSSDGAQFKRISRREVTPMFLKVESLDVKTKKDGKALCLIGICFSDGGVKKNLVEELIRRNFELIMALRISVDVLGRTYNFRIAIMSVIADMKEQAILTTLPNWHNVQGCSRCLTIGKKKSNGKITYDSCFPAQRRTNEDMMQSAQNGSKGFTNRNVPSIYSYIGPTLVNIDPFHIRGAGICKQIVNEFLKPSQWKKARVDSDRLTTIKESIEAIVPYSGDKIKTQCFKKLSKTTGREMDKLSVIVSAVVGVTGSCSCLDFNALFVGWYFCLQFLGSVLAPPQSLRPLLRACYRLHVQTERDSISMKWHNFYEHLLEHEELFGHLHTTEVFEREHKTLMTSVHHQTTNCENILIGRYVTGKIIEKQLQKTAQTLTTDIRNSVLGSMKMNESSSQNETSTANCINWDQLEPQHARLADDMGLNKETQFLLVVSHRFAVEDNFCSKRVRVNTMRGELVFAAKDYWRSGNSTSSLITFADPSNGSFKFASILMIFRESGDTMLLVEEFILEPLRITLDKWASSGISDEAREVLNCCLLFPSTIGEVISFQYSLIPVNSIVCPAIMIDIGPSRYVKISLF